MHLEHFHKKEKTFIGYFFSLFGFKSLTDIFFKINNFTNCFLMPRFSKLSLVTKVSSDGSSLMFALYYKKLQLPFTFFGTSFL